MKKKSSKEVLKGLSTTFVVFAVLFLIAGVVFNLIPGFSENLIKIAKDDNAMIALNAGIIVDIIIYLWYSWLAKRVVNDKSNGTVFMFFLILDVISGIARIIFTPGARGMGTLDFVLSAVTLYYLLKVRKENVK